MNLTNFNSAAPLNHPREVKSPAAVTHSEPQKGPVSVSRWAPLSFPQQRVWLAQQLHPCSSAYNLARALHLKGPLDRSALERGLNEIIRRHEALRTVFVMEDGLPVQKIKQPESLRLEEFSVRGSTLADRLERARELASHDAARPFDLETGPLMRVKLFDLGEQEHLLVVACHQMIMDGWSSGILFSELSRFYRLFRGEPLEPLPTLPSQYSDYARKQHRLLTPDFLGPQLEFWNEQLLGETTTTEDDAIAPVQERGAGTHCLVLSEEMTACLRAFNRREGMTLFMTLLSAYVALLGRLWNRQELRIGTAVSGRNRFDVERLIGSFANTLVLRAPAQESDTFRQLLEQVRDTALKAHAHSDVPYVTLAESLELPRKGPDARLFDAWFSFLDSSRGFQMNSAMALPVHVPPLQTQNDLSLFVAEKAVTVECYFEFRTCLFDAQTIQGLASQFENFLKEAMFNPRDTLGELFWRMDLVGAGGTGLDDSGGETLQGWLEHHARRITEKTAVVCGNQKLTYEELNRRANRLAVRLQQHGVGPEQLVGLCAEPTAEALVGILGVLKSGGAYFPMNPAQPGDAICAQFEAAGVSLVLAPEKFRGRLGASKFIVMDPNAMAETNLSGPATLPCRHRGGDQLACVMLTAGSTGSPKGVMLTHRNLLHSTRARLKEYPEPVQFLVLADSLDCGGSLAGIFWTLASGGTLVLPEEPRNPVAVARLIGQVQATHLVSVPSFYQAVLQQGKTPSLETLGTVIVRGEACPERLAKLHALMQPDCQLYNEFGTTEAAVLGSVSPLKIGEKVTVGKPIHGTTIQVLDEQGHPVADGLAGEICIGGKGVARGYWKQPELTQQQFVADRVGGQTGGRLHRTGDLGRRLANGNVEFLGRVNQRMAIHGCRAELEEIEFVLREFPKVTTALACVRGNTADTGSRLEAFVVTADNTAPSETELRKFLQRRLPACLVPSVITTVKGLPMLSNGTVNRRAVESPEQTLLPRLSIQSQPAPVNLDVPLVKIWQEILGTRNICKTDNFFELGGHSLQVVQLADRVREVFNVELPLRMFFDCPTVEQLSRAVEEELRREDRFADEEKHQDPVAA